MSTERKPFRRGDVCNFIGDDDYWEALSGHFIIDKLSSSDDPEDWSYATDRGAWIDHEDLELVEETSKESRAKVYLACRATSVEL